MSALTNLDAKLQTLGDSITQLKTDMQAAFDALNAKIAAGGDTTAEQATVQTLIDSIGGMDQTAKAVIAPTTPPAPGL